MKKALLIFMILPTLLLCSCRKINQPDNLGYLSSNSSEINSDYISDNSSIISLPERNDFSSDYSAPSDEENIVTSYGEMTDSGQANTSSNIPAKEVKLSIDVDKPYYRSTISAISFTLYNENKSIFTYKTDFFLQIYEDGKWKYHTTKNGEIDYKFNTAESDSHVTSIIYQIDNLYNTPLPYGKYRFIQESDYGTITSNSFEIVEDSFFDGEEVQP